MKITTILAIILLSVVCFYSGRGSSKSIELIDTLKYGKEKILSVEWKDGVTFHKYYYITPAKDKDFKRKNIKIVVIN